MASKKPVKKATVKKETVKKVAVKKVAVKKVATKKVVAKKEPVKKVVTHKVVKKVIEKPTEEVVETNKVDTPIVEEKKVETTKVEEVKKETAPTSVEDKKAKSKQERIRALKFFLFSISAGVIQLGVTTLLGLAPIHTSIVYLIGLVCSVVWNFTFNRKFTFKAANNVPKAMALAFLFYVFFAPASTVLTGYLTNGWVLDLFQLPSWLGILGSNVPKGAEIPLAATVVSTIICMVPNLILEFIWQKLVVFRGSIDTNKKAVNK